MAECWRCKNAKHVSQECTDGDCALSIFSRLTFIGVVIFVTSCFCQKCFETHLQGCLLLVALHMSGRSPSWGATLCQLAWISPRLAIFPRASHCHFDPCETGSADSTLRSQLGFTKLASLIGVSNNYQLLSGVQIVVVGMSLMFVRKWDI